MKKKSGIAVYVEELRNENGLTQTGLDKAAGMPIGTTAQLETGAKPFNDSRLERIAPVLGVTVKQLLMGSTHSEFSAEMELLLAELSGLSSSGLLELTLYVRKAKASGCLI